MKWLLDTNVLFAAVDTAHANHAQTRAWLATAKADGWGVTVETYLSTIRLLMNPRATHGSPLAASDAVTIVRREFRGPHAGKIVPGAEPDDAILKSAKGHNQIPDYYLAQMARETGAKLATRDNGLLANFPANTHRP